jgi:hypothetical protein
MILALNSRLAGALQPCRSSIAPPGPEGPGGLTTQRADFQMLDAVAMQTHQPKIQR